MKQTFKLNTVDRLIAIMSYLASANNPKKLTEIAKQLGFSKASTYRILCSLEKGQWVIRNTETGKYSVGYEILELGRSLLSNIDVKVVGMPHLIRLRDVTGETVGLSIYVGKERMFIEEMQSNHELRYITPLGKRLPLWCGAVGKVILANINKDEADAILNELRQLGVPRLASGQILDIARLHRELAMIRRQGFAISREERERGTSAVAAAIFDHNNEIIGAINICGPCERFQKDVLKKHCVLVREAAENINQQMGARRSHQYS
jgi:DNA-binding IclR family transcriptional regulator